MKKEKWLIVFGLSLMLLFSCSKKAENTVTPITLEFWMNAYFLPGEEKLSRDQWGFTSLIGEFERLHPGVTVEMIVPADQTAAHQTFKAAAMARSGPDVANLWAGTPLFDLRDAVLHLDSLVPKDDLEQIDAWDVVRDNFKGDILAYPATGKELTMLLVNKTLLKSCGYDMDAKPFTTMEALMDACAAVKRAGLLPIVADDEGINTLHTFVFSSQWINLSGSARIASNSFGETKYSDDEGFLYSMQSTADLYTKGFINADYATSRDAFNQFLQGKAVFYPTGNWSIATAEAEMGGDNIDFFTAPWPNRSVPYPSTGIGGVGQCLAIARHTEHPDLAVEFCSFINNRKNTIEHCIGISKGPFRKDVTLDDLGWSSNRLMAKMYEYFKTVGFWTDNSQQADVMNECFRQGTLVVTGKITPAEAAARLDRYAATLK